MSIELRKREQHVTQQWVDKGVFEALRKCADRRPDLMINVRSLKQEEDRIHCRIYVNNVGRVMYTQKLVYFICTALTEYNTNN